MKKGREDVEIKNTKRMETDVITYIIPVLVVTKSLCGSVVNQVQYNMESAQYLG